MTDLLERSDPGAAPAPPRATVLRAQGLGVAALQWGGAGPPVVLLHGLIGSAAYWEPTAVRLAAAGRRVVALDLPGHGGSDALPGGFELERACALIAAALGALGVERPALVGHSLGAAVAAHYAADRPVRALVLASPVGVLPLRVEGARWELPLGRLVAGRLARPCCAVGPLRRLVFRHVVGMARLERLSAAQARELMAAAALAAASVPGYLPALRSLDIGPALERLPVAPAVVYGERDGVGAASGRLIAARAGVRPVVLPDTGHMPMIEAPYAFTAALAESV